MIGQKLGSFRIEGVLGSGAMGVVYRGTQEPSGRPAAIKVILGDNVAKGNLSERFKREADILQQFRHPNIVRFLAVGRSQGTSYFAMEFIDGHTLEKELDDRGPLPWREVLDLGIQICDALQYAHERQIVHRDLKPSNLMLTGQKRVKLTDFGIAKDLDATTALTATGRTLGTAAYMAPEQIRGTPAVSHKTDLYALGVILFQMLAGEPPFHGNTAVVLMHAHLNQDPPRPSEKVVEIPRALDRLVYELMSKDVGRRPFDAAAVGHALTELRDRADRGERIDMVWPGDATDVQATRLGALTMPLPEADSQFNAPRGRAKGRRKGRSSAASGSWRDLLGGRMLETAGLVAALFAVGGLIGYLMWPPSAAYLHAQAERLMASEEYLDWLEARDEYIEALDQRFPDHPYKQQTESWRDRIAHHQAERRAAVLGRPNMAALSRPTSDVPAEGIFVDTFAQAESALKAHDEPGAAAAWRGMAERLGPLGAEARGWLLLARARAEAAQAAAALIRKQAEEELARLERAVDPGRPELAEPRAREYIKRFGIHPYLADLVEHAGRLIPGTAPEAAPPTTGAGPDPTPTP